LFMQNKATTGDNTLITYNIVLIEQTSSLSKQE